MWCPYRVLQPRPSTRPPRVLLLSVSLFFPFPPFSLFPFYPVPVPSLPLHILCLSFSFLFRFFFSFLMFRFFVDLFTPSFPSFCGTVSGKKVDGVGTPGSIFTLCLGTTPLTRERQPVQRQTMDPGLDLTRTLRFVGTPVLWRESSTLPSPGTS